MINYSSYNDVWGISPDIPNKNNDNKVSENLKVSEELKVSENFSSSDNCEDTRCQQIEHILNCDKCLKKLKQKLNIENFKETKETFGNGVINKFGLFNNKVKNILLLFCDNDKKKRLMLLLLISLFIILSFLFVKGRGVESKSKDIEALAEAVGSIDIGSMKYLKENFIMIPKNMINFNNIY